MTYQIIPLALNPALIKTGIVKSFVFNKHKDKPTLVLSLNGAYENRTVVSSVNLKHWGLMLEEFEQCCIRKKVSKAHIEMAKDTIDNNYAVILGTDKSEHFKVVEDADYNEEREEEEYRIKELRAFIEAKISKMKEENPGLRYEEWRNRLTELFIEVRNVADKYYSDTWESIRFTTLVKTILNIDDITLPFIGIMLGQPGSSKTLGAMRYTDWIQTYRSDDFTPASFVTHSATTARSKLTQVDMLPQIRDKMLLTPELAAMFTAPDDEIRSQFGIINRVADGNGLLTNSGVYGRRGYSGTYMFTWVGVAVEIPDRVYRFLAMTGFKLYFLRLPEREKTEEQRTNKILNAPRFKNDMEDIRNALLEYLCWFELCPLNVNSDSDGFCKIPWDMEHDKEKDGRYVITINVRLSEMLARLRGFVQTYKRREEAAEDVEEPEGGATKTTFSTEFEHGFAIIEDHDRAALQLSNYTRAFALATEGRNWIEKKDLAMSVKIMLSTAPMARVKVFRLLIKNDGLLTTSQIANELNVSNHTAKKTMTEFKGLGIADMERSDRTKRTSEYIIELKPQFNWFLGKEFEQLLTEAEST